MNNEYIYRELLDTDGNIVGREYGGRLIRCKDCAHYDIAENGVNGICRKLIAPFDSYEWCSRAEPKEKE